MKVEIGPADAVQGVGCNHGPTVEIGGCDQANGSREIVPGYLEDIFDGVRWTKVFCPEKRA